MTTSAKIVLDYIWYYICPPVARVNPVKIPDNVFYIEILSEGKVFFTQSGVRREYGGGTIFWHCGGEETICETDPSAPYRCYSFILKVNDCQRPVPRVTNWEPVSEAVNFCKECLLAFHAGKSSSMLTDYIYSTLQWKASNANADYLQYPLPLIRSLKYIDKMFLEGITPEDVARAADISKSYLFHIFKQHLQTSPYQLILEKRLNMAKYMLSSDLQPIKKIAAKCCFNSIEVFYRQFHKAFGISPKEYRQKYSVSLLPNALIGH